MSSQLFKTKVPKDIFLNFIKTYGNKHTDHYLFSKVSFKKARHEKAIETFCLLLKKYYHSAKRFYVMRFINYNNFITILRQLCRSHNIPMTSKTYYNKSNYEIIYSFYIDEH